MRFNPPPGWPTPPPGWTPPPSWQPDPSWGPLPDGWQLWIPEDSDGRFRIDSPGAPATAAWEPKVKKRWPRVATVLGGIFLAAVTALAVTYAGRLAAFFETRLSDPIDVVVEESSQCGYTNYFLKGKPEDYPPVFRGDTTP